jgi:hypothetical protein
MTFVIESTVGAWVVNKAASAAKDLILREIDGVVLNTGKKLLQGVAGLPPFSWVELNSLEKNKLGQVDVVDLRKATDRRPHLKGYVSCVGMFLPGTLLNKGWWERSDRGVEAKDFRDNRGVQSWLYNGFYQWAPSWDLNLWEDNDSILLGQIGRIDEADSIPVIIADPAKARVVREQMTALARDSGRLVSHAVVTGKLGSLDFVEQHSRGEARQFVRQLKQHGAIRNHCIVVGDEPKDRIDLHTNRPCNEHYSGYMWKCVCPSEHKNKADTLPYSYFVWEHTDFADKDAINYNIDAMNHKIAYIAQNTKNGGAGGGVTLLQQMMPEDRLRGEPGGNYEKPEIAVNDFMNLFVADSLAAHQKH